MRSILIAAVLAAGPAMAADYIAKQGDDSMRITDKPCDIAEVLARAEPLVRPSLRKAFARYQGVNYVACWRPMGNMVHVIYGDGDQGIVPVSEFKALSEV